MIKLMMCRMFLLRVGGDPEKTEMRFLFWNVRGLGKSSRKKQVREFIEKHKLQMVGLQETMKDSFSDKDLLDIAGSRDFTWQWLPPRGNLEEFSWVFA